jgi:hypothetical protein
MVETDEAVASVASAEPVDAVIISGPRRGEIVRLPADAIPELSEGDLQLLNAALDEVSGALDRLEAEIEATIEAFRESADSH